MYTCKYDIVKLDNSNTSTPDLSFFPARLGGVLWSTLWFEGRRGGGGGNIYGSGKRDPVTGSLIVKERIGKLEVQQFTIFFVFEASNHQFWSGR